MAHKSKRYYAEVVLAEMQNDLRNIDFKLEERDVFVRLDAIVNEMAKQSFLSNWKLSVGGLDEQWLTRWDDVTVVDPGNGLYSYMDLPVHYADLPMNRGIDEIYPMKFQQDGKNHSVVILAHRDMRLYSNNMAGNFQGRLAGFVKSYRFTFNRSDVKKKYGNMGLSLVVRSAADIAIDAPYPIPADAENAVVTACVEWFRERVRQPKDEVRDKNDTP